MFNSTGAIAFVKARHVYDDDNQPVQLIHKSIPLGHPLLSYYMFNDGRAAGRVRSCIFIKELDQWLPAELFFVYPLAAAGSA